MTSLSQLALCDMADWSGEERRSEERSTIYEQLGELRVRVTHIEESLNKLDHVSAQLDSFVKQGQGIGKMLQVLFYVVGPLVAGLYWIKDHLK